MKISDVIERLSKIMSENGDLECGYYNQEWVSFDTLDIVSLRDAERAHDFCEYNDAEVLGDKFVGFGG